MSEKINEINSDDIYNDEDELDAIINDPDFDPLDPNAFSLIDEDGDEWLDMHRDRGVKEQGSKGEGLIVFPKT